MQIAETNIKFSALSRRRSTKRIIIHHSDSDQGDAKMIHGWHLNRGWAGIGYHYVIRTDGVVERGRPEYAIGAHSGPNGNGDSIGVCLIGRFEQYAPNDAQITALVELIKDLETRYGDLKVIGHKDVMATACPGRNFPWAELQERLEDNEVIYKTIDDVPDWGKALVKKLMARGSLAGDGKGNINLPESTLKTLAILEREGVIK